MKIYKKILTAVPIMLILLSCPALAKNNVSDIDIDVTVRNDGSAYIVQNWSGEFDEGTENYIPINTDDVTVSDFRVSDSKGEYAFTENWNVDADFNAKKQKCGINKTDNGVELCFGISQYGQNRYAIEYVISDFIKSYSDYDGTNFMLINPEMSTFPTNGKINIILQNGTKLSTENAAIWAFGFDGEIKFQNGTVTAYTASALDGGNSMIVMLQLNKGIINPVKSVSESFEEVKNKAFENSDYGDDEDFGILGYIILAVIFIVILIVILIVVFLIKRKNAIKKFYKEANYFREVPNGRNINVSHFLAQNFDVADDESLIIGALLLSMINKRCIEPQTEENIGMFGKVKQSVNLMLMKEPENALEKRLYNILASASGDDGILQEKELEKYAYKHPEMIKSFIDGAKADGEAMFTAKGGFSDGSGNCIKDLSAKGKTELAEVMGLKKYLDEFSLISERGINEAVIWKDYMVYATLFGIADKVIKQLEKVYPDKITEFENYNRNVIIAHSYYHSMHRSAERAMQAARTSGAGGHSSIGGGGGFSGGGSGGGSR